MTNRFVVVASPDRPLPPSAAALPGETTPLSLAWTPVRTHRWSDRSGSVHVACWERDGSTTMTTGPDTVLVSGSPWPRHEVWLPGVSVLHAIAFAASSPGWDPAMDLGGAYALASIDREGNGFVASDPLGLHPLYVAEEASFTVVSDRADLVADAIGRCTGRRPTRSTRCGAWLSFAAYLIGDETGFDGVRALAAGEVVHLRNGRAEIVQGRVPWDVDPGAPLRDPDEVGELLAADVVRCLRTTLARSSERPWFELTGGKDSRLLLGITAGAGLQDEFRYVTYGPDSLPDVQIAQTIATQLDLDHHRRSPGSASRSELSMADRYRIHVQATSGMSNCHESRLPDQRTAPVISGLLGESYRTANQGVADAQPRDWDDAADRFRRFRKFGDAGLLRPDAAQQLTDEAVAFHLSARDRIRGPEDLRPAYFLGCHLPRWQGPLVESHPNRVLPFYSPAAIRGAFEMGCDARSTEHVHQRLVTRGSASLAELPFANDTWRTATAPRPEATRGPINSRRVARPRSRTERTRVLRDIVDRCPDSALYDMVDPDALRDGIERFSSLRPLEKQQVMGAVTSLIWLGELELRPTTDRLVSATRDTADG